MWCRDFWLVLFMGYVAASGTQAAGTHPKLSPGEEIDAEQCAECHSKAKHLTQLNSIDKCERCHGTMDHEPRLRKVAQALNESKRPFNKLGLPPEKKPPPAKKLSPTAGMRFPLYYHGSRIGAKPNEMVLIPAGKFIMGTDDRLPDEGPQHSVYLDAFYIDIYEVTNLQYKQFNDAENRRSPAHFRNRTFPEGKADHPVTFVSWEDADAYCRWTGKRLPTDQEWEKAARSEDGRMFPWGDEFDATKANTPIRWQQIGGFGDTTPVGAFEQGKSAYGLYDTTGNVWEWTASWYTAYPGNKKASESYGERYKTLKGGSWFDCSFYKCGISAPVFNRAFFAVRTKNDSFGFRCAKDAKPENTRSGENES